MRAVVFTLGCKVNEVESASIMAELEKDGYEVDDKLSFADVYVLNTCAVTAEAEKKSRQLVARARKFNPNAQIFVCGCASQKDEKPFLDKNVTFVCGARHKEQVVSAILKRQGIDAACQTLAFPKETKARAFVKIEDGCNRFCSYCIIPYLRGRVISRPVDDVLCEIERLTAVEVVLTGIDLSAYRDGETDLAGLIERLRFCQKRIRLGSLECRVIDDRLLTALQALPDFAPQFHLSLQSGSSSVLKRMNRHYTRETFLEKCALIYRYFPHAAVTTDIIVGFCGETEEEFAESLSVIREAKLVRVHAFAFSPREGTVAYTLPDIPADLKSRRLHELLQEGETARIAYLTDLLKTDLPCVLEEQEGDYTVGTAADYAKIYIKGRYPVGGKAVVKAQELYADGLLCTLVSSERSL